VTIFDLNHETVKLFLVGGGELERRDSLVRMRVPANGSRQYADAQLDDYHGLKRRHFLWQPPLRLTVRARASHPVDKIGGTLGFGFWNDPFTLTGGGVLSAPRAIWFFGASPPNDMYLVDGVPGFGWKAAVLDAGCYPALLVAPAAAVAIALTRVPGLGAPIMHRGRRAVRAAEKLLPAQLTDWQEYQLEWHADCIQFHVDGELVLESGISMRGPLGFLTWIDNQYAIVSESGTFRFGLIENTAVRWLELDALRIERL